MPPVQNILEQKVWQPVGVDLRNLSAVCTRWMTGRQGPQLRCSISWLNHFMAVFICIDYIIM